MHAARTGGVRIYNRAASVVTAAPVYHLKGIAPSTPLRE
jgi:hypothetical protein